MGALLLGVQETALSQQTIMAGSYASIQGASLGAGNDWSCFWPWDAAGPIDYMNDAMFACNDPVAHPENMPVGTAFTYDALTGSGGDFTAQFNGQCYYPVWALIGPTYFPAQAPPLWPQSQATGRLYDSVGAQEPTVTLRRSPEASQ